MTRLELARQLSLQQTEYYKDSEYRYKSANIIACLLSKERFDEYYSKSISWQGKLNKALKDYALKMYRDRFTSDREKELFDELNSYIIEQHTKKFILSNPKYYDYRIDRDDTDIMLRQLVC